MLPGLLKRLSFLAVFLLFLLTSSNAYASSIDTNRLAGIDRFATSVEISKQGWPEGSKNIVIVSGMNFPDALCSAPLAKLYNAPILLTDQLTMPSSVLNEVKRLNPENIYIVGGSGVVSDNIIKTLNSNGLINIHRIAGLDRFDTSIRVASEIDKLTGGYSSIAVVSGMSFPDALSIAPIAASKTMPIILTDKDYLPNDSYTYLKGKNIDTSYIVGASGVISDNVKNYIAKFSNNVERLAGINRFDTNTKVLEKFENELDFSSLYITDGLKFPDALATSAIAGKDTNASPLILTDGGNFSSELYSILNRNFSSIARITAIGGTPIVPDSVFNLSQLSLKKSKIIVVDPGHGGYQPGASGNGLVEKDINLDIGLRTRDLLSKEGYTTYMTRETDTTVSLADRVALAKNVNANLFLSIHQNSYTNSVSNGSTVLYNSNSNFSSESKELAILIRDEIVSALGTKSLEVVDRSDLYVLNYNECVAVLAEVAFVSNPSDADKIRLETNRQKVAQAFVNAINKYYGFK